MRAKAKIGFSVGAFSVRSRICPRNPPGYLLYSCDAVSTSVASMHRKRHFPNRPSLHSRLAAISLRHFLLLPFAFFLLPFQPVLAQQKQCRKKEKVEQDGREKEIKTDRMDDLHVRASDPSPSAGVPGIGHALILNRGPVKTKHRALKKRPSSSPSTAKARKPAMPPTAPKKRPPRNLPRISCSITGNW